ncbi:MAG: glycosyltransferase family 4 protein [Desulfonatronovibrionaceae bacterium]
MKILQINTEKTWRGGERQTFLTALGLMQAGHQVAVLCLKGRPLHKICLQHSIQVLPAAGQKNAFGCLLRHGQSFDILHAQTGKGQSLAVASRPWHCRPVIYTRRVDFRPKGTAARIKYRLTTEVAAISPAIRDIIAPLAQGKTIPVIPSCIDTSRPVLKPCPRALALRQKYSRQAIIATTAALVPHKDPLTMVRAIYALKKISPDQFIFLHFGQGRLLESVRQEINRLDLDREYLLMGFDPEVERWFPVFDIFAMSSSEEGLGSSVLEAFRYKIPVVSTDAGGLRDLVSGRGLLCPAGHHECLAAKLKQLLNEPEQHQDMVSRAYDHVLNMHSLEKMTSDYILVYQNLLETS